MKTALLLLFFLYTINSQAQHLGKDTILVKICHSKYLTTGDPGEGDFTQMNKCFDLLVALKMNYTSKEILKLSHHIDPKVKCYAFWALAQMKHPKVRKIISRNIKDTTSTFMVDFGCFAIPMSPFDYMLKILNKCHHFFDDNLKISKKEIIALLEKRKKFCSTCYDLSSYKDWNEYLKYTTNCSE